MEVNVRISGASGCDGQTLDGGAAVEQAEIHRRALVQLGEVLPGSGRVAVGFPAAAAGEVAALIFDKAHHIGEGVAQKYADLMGKISLTAEPPGQLPQQRRIVVRLLGKVVPLAAQEVPHLRLGQQDAQPALTVDVHEILVRPHTALEDADAEAFFVQLLIPAADAAGKVCAVSGLIAEESRRLQASQFVAEHGDQVCPAKWQPGAETLKPSLDLVGML